MSFGGEEIQEFLTNDVRFHGCRLSVWAVGQSVGVEGVKLRRTFAQ